MMASVVLSDAQDSAIMNTNNPILADYVDRDALAEFFNVSSRTITRWAGQPDGIPAVRIGSRTL